MIRRTQHNRLKLFQQFVITFIGAVLLNTADSYAASTEVVNGVTVFKSVPSAYELAKSLFPPTTRSFKSPHDVGQENQATAIAFMINFEFDSVDIKPISLPYLDILGYLLGFDKVKHQYLRISGHADAKGDVVYNQQLSKARAEAIKQYLAVEHKISPDRLRTVGYGESQLLNQDNPYAAINRRVEFSPWVSTRGAFQQ